MRSSPDRTLKYPLLLLLFLIPLVFTHRATTYTITKEAAVQFLGFFVFACWVYSCSRKGNNTLPARNSVNVPVLLFIFWTGLSALWAKNSFESMEKLILLMFLAAAYFAAVNRTFNTRALSLTVAAAATLVSVYGLLQFRGADFIKPHPMALVSTLGNVNFAGEYLAAAIPIGAALVWAAGKMREKLLFGFMVSLQLTHLLLTKARGAWMGLFAGAAVLIILAGRNKRGKKQPAVFLSLVLFAALFLLIFSAGLNGLEETVSEFASIFDLNNPTVLFRLHAWKNILGIAKDNLFLGTGAGNLRIIYPAYRSLEEWRISGIESALERAHNDYLEIASELGIIGLGIFVWILVSAFRTAARRKNGLSTLDCGFLSALVCMLAIAFFGFPLNTPSTAVLFWVALGVIASPAQKPQAEKKGTAAPKSKLLFAGTILLGVLVFSHTGRWYFSDFHLKKAYLHREANDPDSAREELIKSINLYYPRIKTHVQLGRIYMDAADLQNAYFTMQSILILHPNHPWANRVMGEIYLRMGEREKAFRLLERAAGLNPAFLNNLGLAYMMTGETENAKAALYRIISIGFDDEFTYALLGQLYETTRDEQKPIKMHEPSPGIDPGPPANRPAMTQ